MTPYWEVNFSWLSKRPIIGTGSYTSGLYASDSGEACLPKNTKHVLSGKEQIEMVVFAGYH